jgi:hypothetical protein
MKRTLLFWSTLAVLGHLTTVLSFSDARGNMNSIAAIFRNLDYRPNVLKSFLPDLFAHLPDVSSHSDSFDQCKAFNNKPSQHLLFLKTGELFKKLLLWILMLIVFGLMRKFTHI